MQSEVEIVEEEAVEEPEAVEEVQEEHVEEKTDEDPCACTMPVKDWLAQDPDPDKPGCRPCVLPFLVQWYGQELGERNMPEQAAKFQGLENVESLEPETVAELCDQVKEEVDEDTRNRLREFDCHVQVNVETLGKEENHGQD